MFRDVCVAFKKYFFFRILFSVFFFKPGSWQEMDQPIGLLDAQVCTTPYSANVQRDNMFTEASFQPDWNDQMHDTIWSLLRLFLKHPLQNLKIALEFVSDRVFPQKKITYLDKISSRHSPSLTNPGSMNMQILLMSKVKQLQARSLLLHQKVRP